MDRRQILVIIVSLASSLFAARSDSTACKQFGETHTLCKFKGISKDCKGLFRGLDNTEKEAIVALHNKARSKVALGEEKRSLDGPMPAAADMIELEWDEELAVISQRWADQCIPNTHDKTRGTDEFQFVGQNVATTWSSNKEAKASWENAINLWYDEVKDYSSVDVSSFAAPSRPVVVGHFTQVIWGKTRKVGCGYVSFKDTTFTNIPFAHLYICNYGLAGNFLGEPIYTSGKPCSACPSDAKCSSRFRGLCSVKTEVVEGSTSTPTEGAFITTSFKQAHRFSPSLNSSRFFKLQPGTRPPKLVTLESTALSKPRNLSTAFARPPLRRPTLSELSGRSVSSSRPDEVNQVNQLGSVLIPCHLFGEHRICEFEQQGEPWDVTGQEVSIRLPSRKSTVLFLKDSLEPRPTSPTGRYCLRMEFIRFLPIAKDLSGVNVTAENFFVILTPSTGKEVQIPVAPLSTNEKEWLEAKVTLSGFRDRTKLALRQSGPVISRGKIPILRSNVSIEVSIGSISLNEGHC